MLHWFPKAASSYAGDVDDLIVFITAIVGVWFLAAEALLIYFSFRYKRKPGKSAAYLPGRSLRSMCAVLVPCAVVLMFDLAIDVASEPVWEEVKEDFPPPDRVIRVTGMQWAWAFTLTGPDGKFDTKDDIQLVNDLHLPLNEVIQFELRSRDVLHSFWIPAFRLKQDAVPGRMIRGWFKPTVAGRYQVICAEICGLMHTMMAASLTIESSSDFNQWLASKSIAAAASQG